MSDCADIPGQENLLTASGTVFIQEYLSFSSPYVKIYMKEEKEGKAI